MKRFKEYITEKTFNINKDVDYIYNKFFRKPIKSMQAGTYKYPQRELTFGKMYSKDLPSKTAQKANDIRPIIIKAGILDVGNAYAPLDSKICLSINKNAVSAFNNPNINTIEDAESVVPEGMYDRFKNEFSESAIKGSIHHELAHWMNDAIYNLNLSKSMLKAKQFSDVPAEQYNFLKRGEIDIDVTFMEIDAQVNAVKQLKKNYKKEWDNIDLYGLQKIKPSFNTIFKNMKSKGKAVYDRYMKRLFHRLDREKLLGKSMRYISYETF